MTFRIGSGAGFSGDRVDAGLPVVKALAAAGQGGAIVFETIGERTLALGHLARRQDPALGYEPLLIDYLEPILAACIENGISIVGNFGCANPQGAAAAIAGLGRRLGLPPLRIATVTGDDVRDHVNLNTEDLWEGDSGLKAPAGEIVSANAYIGAGAIADALTAGAQIVVTGRVADPALVLGPLVAHFGWAWDDLDRIAGGTLVGHLLECGAQVTGGYFADPGFKDVPRPEAIGFPIAEVEADGSFVITKPPASGGLVDLRTVKEQLLYEIHDPAAYLTPDVTLDITGVEIVEVGPDRVAVRGARGHAPPEKLKATVGFLGDWFGEGEISYAGPNALARVRLAADVIRKRLELRGLDLRHRLDVIGVSSAFDDDSGSLWTAAQRGGAQDQVFQDLRLRLAVAGPRKDAVESALQEVLALYCCGPAGGGGQRNRVTQRIETRSYLVARDNVAPGFSFV